MSQKHYRLIAIDLDGTLIAPGGVVTPRTKAAIHRAAAQGLRICYATGRSWRESRYILDDVGHHCDGVFVTGALVVETSAGQTLHHRLMGAELAREVAHFFESRGQTALALQHNEQGTVDYLATEGSELNASTRQWLKMTRTTVEFRGDLKTAPHERTLRISIVADTQDVQAYHGQMLAQLGSRVAYHCLVLPVSGLQVMEVFEPDVNKWQGVLHVAGKHGIAADQIIAVGDDVNDLPMIRGAGLGIAMGNAPAHVQAEADRVIGRNGEDGLAVFLEELIDGQAAKGLALTDGRRT